MRIQVRLALGLLLAAGFAGGLQAREISFEERVEAQRAIERVYYSHQIGTTEPFDRAVSEETLHRKVRATLEKSAALERFWNTPITAAALQAETDRILRGTRFPGRLAEIDAALGHDPFLFQECFARATLVERLTRSFFSADSRIHAEARLRADRLHELLIAGEALPEGEVSPRMIEAVKRVSPAGADPAAIASPADRVRLDLRLDLDEEEFGAWRERMPRRIGEVGAVQDDGDSFTVAVLVAEDARQARVASYAVRKIEWDSWWRGARSALEGIPVAAVARPERAIPSAELATEAVCAADNTWSNGILDDLPDPRETHTAVWSGTVMIVWGGTNGSHLMNTGARYDPLTDTWSSTSTDSAPSERQNHTAAWTGSVMVIWGGQQTGGGALNTGGRYDPVSDAWSPVSTTNAAGGRNNHTAVWTGTEMLVWGGKTSTFALNSGGRYNPATDTWSAMSATNAPAGRFDQVAVWTGSVMVVWGGFNSTYVNTGGRYNPATNTWLPTSLTLPPAARTGARGVWTGSVMVVWGGTNGAFLDSGGRYDPAGDVWSWTSQSNAPSGRQGFTAVWTGSRMAVWGGDAGGAGMSSGGLYDPPNDRWDPLASTNAPGGRRNHTAVWTGSQMIVWGGSESAGAYLNSGGRYSAAGGGAWTPTSTGSGPSPRSGHTAVWTGNAMIVWGGIDAAGSPLGNGGAYDPAADSWSLLSMSQAPAARRNHTAVWAGSSMMVWGGFDGSPLATGGRYDPLSDAWSATSMAGAPSARAAHTAVWSGTWMVVWGGTADFTTVLGTGARYDPASDAWSPVSLASAPAPRRDHTAVWTGAVMVVWGGRDALGALGTGAQYHPASNSWLVATSTGTGVAQARYGHSAVWTGTVMMIWGGTTGSTLINSGSRYNPGPNSWALTSVFGSPTARSGHTGVWMGGAVVLWGGFSTSYQNTGARYNPATDLWSAVASAGAPGGRSNHTAVSTGGWMLVWGGAGNSTRNTGGRYALGQNADADSDGTSVCAGDCNDANAAIHPGAAEVCNGMDDDCSGEIDEGFDQDGDGFATCRGDCDDAAPAIHPGAAEACNGIDDDCDASTDEGGDALCADSSQCTQDACGGAAGCVHSPWPDDTSCDDADACTSGDVCRSGVCTGRLRDSDGDFRVDHLCGGADCDDGNAQVWLPALEVANLRLTTAVPADPAWNSQGSQVGPETRYDLMSGDLAVSGAFDFPAASCLLSAGGNAFSDPRSGPATGAVTWYLARARNSCGVGTYGTAGRDAGLPPSP